MRSRSVVQARVSLHSGGEWPLALSALQSLGLAKLEAWNRTDFSVANCKPQQATARSRYITASVIQADAFTWTSAISACEKARFVQSAGTAK